jgi:methylglyoxal synthase
VENLPEQTREQLDLHGLKEGPKGGVVAIAGMIVEGACKIVIFFTDSDDQRFNSTENGALFRVGNVHGAKILLNKADADSWVQNEFEDDRKKFALGLPRSRSQAEEEDPQKIVALIAHDNKKEDMYKFAMLHKEALQRGFKKIIATGHTGIGVMKATGGDLKVEALRSGPEGGDVEIANEVLRSSCGNVIFFMDPLTSHPHFEDIRLLLNICSLEGINVTLRTNYASAESWIKSIERQLKRS